MPVGTLYIILHRLMNPVLLSYVNSFSYMGAAWHVLEILVRLYLSGEKQSVILRSYFMHE